MADRSIIDDGMAAVTKLFLLQCNSQWFKQTSFILFLNKMDLFREKISRVDLTTCFPSYTGGCNYDNATEYIMKKFLDQNKSPHPVSFTLPVILWDAINDSTQIYPHLTCAISTQNIEFVFKCIRDTVLKQILQIVIVY